MFKMLQRFYDAGGANGGSGGGSGGDGEKDDEKDEDKEDGKDDGKDDDVKTELEGLKKEVKPFTKWVTNEILPSVRKHGMYATDNLAKAKLYA